MKNGLFQDFLGNKIWFKNNLVHRIGSPALFNGNYSEFMDRLYYRYGLIHRLDGQARIFWQDTKEWYVCNINITDQLHSYCTGNNIDIHNYTNISKSDKLKLKIKFGLQL